MKKLLTVSLSFLLTFVFCISSFASYDYSGGERLSLLYDNADLLTESEETELLAKLEEISATYECETAILTVNTTDEADITAFSDDYYDYNGFGYGENDDGLILVVDMGSRAYYISTHGKAIDIFTDSNLSYLENAFVSFLSQGDYYYAFSVFASKCDEICYEYQLYLNGYNENFTTEDEYYHNDEYYNDDDYYYNGSDYNSSDKSFDLTRVIVIIAIGLIIAFIYTSVLKSQLKTVRSKASAQDYVIPGSLQITQQRDVFMYSNLKKTPKPKQNSSNRSGGGRASFGGGSSTHTSSSGRTHGGSGGRF